MKETENYNLKQIENDDKPSEYPSVQSENMQVIDEQMHELATEVTPIERGGTGASTAAKARTNLGVYSKSEVDTALGNFVTTKATQGPAYGPLVSVTAKGHAEQDGTTGKNLLNLSAPLGVGSINSYSYSEPTLTVVSGDHGTPWILYPIGPLSELVGTTLTLSIGSFSSQKSSGTVHLFYYDSSKYANGGVTETTQTPSNYSPRTITVRNATKPDFNIDMLGFLVYADYTPATANTVALSNIQLEVGSTATPYEPYTGGKPSPNPDYPQEIRVVRGRNLLDVSTVQIGKAWNLNTSSARAIVNVSCEPNTTYTVSNAGGTVDGLYAYEKASSADTTAIANYDLAKNGTRTITTNANTRCITIQFNKGAIATGDVESAKPQLELGSTAHPYVPYGHVGLDVTADGTTTTTPIPLPSRGWVGSLPDGTHDALSIDGAGHVTWELADAVVRVSDLSFDYDSTNQRFIANMGALGVRGIGTSRLVPMLSDSFVAKWHGEAYDASWDGVAYIGGVNLILHAHDYDNVTDLVNALANVSFYYPLATATTEDMGYVDLPDIPEGAVVSMPELEGLGVESWTSDAVARYVRAWAARR